MEAAMASNIASLTVVRSTPNSVEENDSEERAFGGDRPDQAHDNLETDRKSQDEVE
jgi:hypothetical protein